jgi:prepilin-type N-terminal cleavage/methylation domain-containing protein
MALGMHLVCPDAGPSAHGREGKVTNRKTERSHRTNAERGFSMIELLVVTAIIFIVAAMAIIQMNPSIASQRSDAAMRQVVDQLRQAREYSIENRRYVAVTFQTVGSQAQIVTTQKNSQTTGAGTDQVLSTVVLQSPVQYCVCSMPDTPDAFGNGASVYFEGTANGPTGGMWFQSDGELVDGASLQPINGAIYLGITNQGTLSRAITIMGTTGRVRSYKSTGSKWFSS